MAQEHRCPTYLIADAPTKEDRFGAHQRLAKAISDLITSRDETGGKTIGIEGNYGSGKSTVVNLLRASLIDNPDIAIIFIDAWAHEGDPLRRTFLENVIKSLRDKGGWINETEWVKRQEELARRRKITDKTTFPQLSTFGTCIAIGFLLIPIGLAFLNDAIKEGFSFNFIEGIQNQQPIGWRGIISFIVVINPIVQYIFFNILIGFLSKIPKSVKQQIKSHIPKRLSQQIIKLYSGIKNDFAEVETSSVLGALLSQKVISRDRTETIENPDPTSVEFEKTFCDLMEEALSSYPDRRIVLVLDNLDRVTSKDVRSLLSSLQTFLQHSEHQQTNWFNRLWVLIPFDRDSLSKLWKNERVTSNGKLDSDGKKEDGSNEDRDGKGDSLARAFLDKSFQVRFEVPPLLVSDWHSYLNDLLRKAFPSPSHTQMEFHDIYRVYDVYRRNRISPPPTPRDLILFVNQIGSLHRQWGDTFPLHLLAYYVLLRREDESVVDLLREEKIPDLIMVNFLGDIEGARDNLAALAFGTDVSTARQFLIGDLLENALSQGNIDDLKKLASFKKGFFEVLENVRFINWATSENVSLANSAFCIKESCILEDASPSERASIIISLRQAVLLVNSWQGFNESIAKGLSALIALSPDETLAVSVINGISSGRVKEDQKNETSQIESWVKGVLNFLSSLESVGLTKVIDQHRIRVPLNVVGYFEACSLLYSLDKNGRFWNFVDPSQSTTDLLASLSTLVSEGKFSAQLMNVIQVLLYKYPDIEWEKFSTSVGNRLQINPALPSQEVSSLLSTLITLNNKLGKYDSQLQGLANQGYLLHHLYNIQSDPEAAAWCLFVYLTNATSIVNSPTFGNSSDGYSLLVGQIFKSPKGYAKLIDNFVDNLVSRGHFESLFHIMDLSVDSKEWVLSCVSRAVERGDSTEIFSPNMIVDHWGTICEALEEEQCEAFLGKIIRDTSLTTYLAQKVFDLDYTDLYSIVVRTGEIKKSDKFVKICVDGLSNLDFTAWKQEYSPNGGSAFELVIELLSMKAALDLGTSYQDILVNYAQDLMKGNNKLSYLSGFEKDLPKALKTAGRKNLRSRLLKAAEERNGNIHNLFFDIFGDEIVDTEVLKGDMDLVSALFTPLLIAQNIRGLDWISSVVKKYPGLLNRHKPKYKVEDFKERIRNEIKGSSDNQVFHTIHDIANVLHVSEKQP